MYRWTICCPFFYCQYLFFKKPSKNEYISVSRGKRLRSWPGGVFTFITNADYAD